MANDRRHSQIQQQRQPEDLAAAYDMDASTFDADLYLQKVLKDCSLKQVMDTEAAIVRDTQTLHSDMQTLVYENYNKFISATDTIRQMKTEFKQMETEMNLLMTKMSSINEFSGRIAGTMRGTRQQLGQLSGKHALLQKLQFLSSLPGTLKRLRADGNYRQAVVEFGQAQKWLQQYGQQPSFRGIHADCERTMAEIRVQLRTDFEEASMTAGRLAEIGALLMQLDERPADLAHAMLANVGKRLHQHVAVLQDQTDRDGLQRFVELSVEGFLNDLSLAVGSYTEMFFARNVLDKESDDFADRAAHDLNAFVSTNMDSYLALVQERVDSETGRGDSGVLLRALDRLYRRLVAMRGLKCDVDLTKAGLEIVINAANRLCEHHQQSLRDFLADRISSVRLALTTATAPTAFAIGGDQQSCGTTAATPNLNELVTNLYQSTVQKVRGVLQDLLIFVQPDLSFRLSADAKGAACIVGIRENLLVGFLRHAAGQLGAVASAIEDCIEPPTSMHLVLARTCLDFERDGSGACRQLLAQADELYDIDAAVVMAASASASATPPATLTTAGELCTEWRSAAQRLIDAYVRQQSVSMSQMLRKSVETRDWLNCLEPRTVRAVMKRYVEELADIETVVGELFEAGGTATTASSDSSRRGHSGAFKQQQLVRSTWSGASSFAGGVDFASSVHRLFSERVEIFGSVEFSKVSIVTGVVKISLKTLLECIRLRTLSRFGLQQVQVDVHYLQMHLWRFVSDENVLHYLLDEILGSAVHRCLEPILMEPNAVEIICERG